MPVIFLILFSVLCADTYSLFTNVLTGLREVGKDRKWYAKFPSDTQVWAMAKEIDKYAEYFKPVDVLSLYVAESRIWMDATSIKNAYGIAQLTPATKKYLLWKYGIYTTNISRLRGKIVTNLLPENDIHSPVQDVRLSLTLLLELRKTLTIKGKLPTFENLVWAYNAGAGTVLSGGWLTNSQLVWIQPGDLAKSVRYYRDNYVAGIFDIDYDYPGWRYEKEYHDDKVFARIGRPHKEIKVSLSKRLMWAGNKTFRVGVGEIVKGKCRTPIGTWRFIWRIWYSRGVKEGGPFGVCFLRLNTKAPWEGTNVASVGVHGTDDERKVGTYNSWGCIQLSNKDAAWLYSNYVIGDYIKIVP